MTDEKLNAEIAKSAYGRKCLADPEAQERHRLACLAAYDLAARLRSDPAAENFSLRFERGRPETGIVKIEVLKGGKLSAQALEAFGLLESRLCEIVRTDLTDECRYGFPTTVGGTCLVVWQITGPAPEQKVAA
jgi:hypothetical protein